MRAYHWPGNVRELRNVIARAVALSPAGAEFDTMPILLRRAAAAEVAPATAPIRADRPFREVKAEVVNKFETDYLTDLMQRARGNVPQAARVARLERKYLYRLLERAGLRGG